MITRFGTGTWGWGRDQGGSTVGGETRVVSGGLRGGPYAALTGAVAALGPLTPAPVADWLYGGVAANRYRFGEADQCRLWDDGFDDRFVPDPGGLESTEG